MFEWKEYFDPNVIESGKSYARHYAVKHITKRGNTFDAKVQGTELYYIKLHYDGYRIMDSSCSCPYASRGNYCKHMAAVLYKIDELKEEAYFNDKEDFVFPSTPSKTPVSGLISAASRDQLEGILLELAKKDSAVEDRIRIKLAGVIGSTDINIIQKEINAIFKKHSEYGHRIYYDNAASFTDDVITYLENKTDRLFDDREYHTAFEISKYVFLKLGNWDIIDDGETSAIPLCCYKIWQTVVENCSDSDRALIKKWFLDHSEDETIDDYYEDVIYDFLKYELASKKELEDEIKNLDEIINSCAGSNECRHVYTIRYGYDLDAVGLRTIFMKRLGASEEEIDSFRRKYMSFRSVREYYIRKAKDEKDTAKEVRLLIESKKLDANSPTQIHSYSQRLIELYHIQKDRENEKKERKYVFLSSQSATLDDFRSYRSLCSEEEWVKERTELINSRLDIEKKCDLLVEELMFSELIGAIFAQDNRLHLLNKYGYLLADAYSDQILPEYIRHVSFIAERARNTASYNELTEYLKRMQQYNGGSETVQNLCREWMQKYPTRKIMCLELQKFL